MSSNSTNALAWIFGDGNSSTLANPLHTYSSAGTYTVQLIETNACGSDTTSRLITVGATNINQTAAMEKFNPKLSPNPFEDFTILSFNNPNLESLELLITDLQGKEIRRYADIKENLASGSYIYTLTNNKLSYSDQFVVK